MKVLVTGAAGFIGKNLVVRLQELEEFEVVPFTRDCSLQSAARTLKGVAAVVHLAAVNRPPSPEEYATVNTGFTESLCRALRQIGPVPVIFASSLQAALANPYGKSKRDAERILEEYGKQSGVPVHIYRLPNVFGKWCRPNYNSVVATFCHSVARGLPITINDADAPLTLAYVDDVVDEFIRALKRQPTADANGVCTVPVQYRTTVGELARQIHSFRDSRETLAIERVGTGLTRALYATYVSYLPPEDFSYGVRQHADARGVFVEMLKTADSGQFSMFTAHPGVTRGGHYHHTKTEKFLVVQGTARFSFRNILTNETYSILTSAQQPRIVESIPGWAHDVTNVGDDEMVVMLWANEVYDRSRPDTVRSNV